MSLRAQMDAEREARKAKRDQEDAERQQARLKKDAEWAIKFGHYEKAIALESESNVAQMRADEARSRKAFATAHAESLKNERFNSHFNSSFSASFNQSISLANSMPPSFSISAGTKPKTDVHVIHHYPPAPNPVSPYPIGKNIPVPTSVTVQTAPPPSASVPTYAAFAQPAYPPNSSYSTIPQHYTVTPSAPSSNYVPPTAPVVPGYRPSQPAGYPPAAPGNPSPTAPASFPGYSGQTTPAPAGYPTVPAPAPAFAVQPPTAPGFSAPPASGYPPSYSPSAHSYATPVAPAAGYRSPAQPYPVAAGTYMGYPPRP